MTENEMTHKERVLAALEHKPVDTVPWIEGIVENRIASKVCGQEIDVDWSVAPDGFSATHGGLLAKEQIKVNQVLEKSNIQFCAFAPIFARKMSKASDGSPVLVGEGLIRTREDFDKIFKLPLPSDNSFVSNAKEFIKYKEDYCACACVRLGIGATLLSMGLEAFSFAMADDPGLITDIHDSYTDWTVHVVHILEEIGFDVIWSFDDVAFNSGPVFNPEYYIKNILPKEQRAVESFTRPLITHSDGDMDKLLPAWLMLGQKAIHPIQPDVMDIMEVKKKYGKKVCIVGNVFMDDLVNGAPENIENSVCELMNNIGKDGGYIISSSNSLTDNMKPENIIAMRDAIQRYGKNTY